MSELSRREILEAVTALALAGCATTPAEPAPLANELATGSIWDDFCNTLAAAGEHLQSAQAPDSELDRAEGHRMLTRLLALAIEMVVESSDADRPVFYELQSAIRKYAGDNPDQRYAAAMIAGDRRYRISGERGNALLVEIGVYAGNFSGGGARRLVASLTEEDLVFARDGSIELELGPEVEPGRPNQVKLAPDAISVLIRQYFADPHDKRASWRIERVPKAEPAPPLAARVIGARLAGAAAFVERNAKTWVDYVGERRAGVHNQLTAMPDAGDLQTPKGIRYLEGYWSLAPDEALVLEFEPEPVPYWGFLIMNFWMESLEWRDRRVSVNNRQAVTEPGAKTVRIVVAARNPGGHPNWIDTAGHREGLMSLRWARHPKLPEVRARVVPIDSLA